MQVEGTKISQPLQENWHDFLQKTALSLACLLLASAGVCWVAANWQHASHLQKLAGGQILLAVLALCAALACLRRGKGSNHNFSMAANLAGLAAVATGALLALVGQIYQTGADPWQLFLLWALLLLPWLLVLRTVFLGLLVAVLLNTALALYLYIEGGAGGWTWLDGTQARGNALLLAGLNLVLLLGWEVSLRQLADRWRIGPRLLSAAAIGWWFLATLGGGLGDSGVITPAISGILVMAVLYAVYTRVRPDLALVSLAMAGAFMLAAVPLVYAIGSEGGLLLVILVLLGLALAGIWHLGALARAHFGPQGDDPAAREGEPWFIALFRMVAVGLIAILIMVLLALLLDLSEQDVWGAGLGIGALGVLVYRLGRSGILRDTAIVLTASGIIMFGLGVFLVDLPLPMAVLALLAVGVVVYTAMPNAVMRFLTALVVLGCVAVISWSNRPWDTLFFILNDKHELYLFDIYLRVWLFSVLAVLTLLAANGRGDRRRWTPLAWALVILAQAAAWVAPAPTLLGNAPVGLPLGLVWLASALLPVLALGALLWNDGQLPRILRVAAPLALAVASLGWMGAPGISLGVLWLVFGHALRRRGLIAFGVLGLLVSLGSFYYQLEASLLHKSLILGATGAWLLLSWLVLRRWPARAAARASATGERRSHWAPAGVLAGLMLVLAVVNTGIYQREAILAHGTRVVLALAPVDPRSLMQGDYMALDFVVAREVAHELLDGGQQGDYEKVLRQGQGYLLLRRGSDGVDELAAVLDALPAAGGADKDSVALEFRLRQRHVRVVTNAWFFPEGQASRYARARYGEFRVSRDGTGLLVGMLDGKLQPL